MDAKTITMYDRTGSLADCDVFLLSKKTDDQKYDTKSVTYETLREGITNASTYSISSQFGFGDLSSVQEQVLDQISTILSGTPKIEGTSTFGKTPLITDPLQDTIDDIPDNGVVTKNAVKNIMVEEQVYVGKKSFIQCYPRNSEGYTYDASNENLMRWRIGAGMNDSSMFRMDDGSVAGPVVCQKDGLLVCYGWLADQGNTVPDNCWVGIFGKIRNQIDEDGNYTESYTALQIQPWILGQNSQTAQYIGFTIPVRAGLELKIKTGFRVNGNPGWFGEGDSLMLSNGSSINMFVGYIIQ